LRRNHAGKDEAEDKNNNCDGDRRRIAGPGLDTKIKVQRVSKAEMHSTRKPN
jgi:hypothetical protein